MYDFHLFRVKLLHPIQPTLFHPTIQSREDLLRQTIESLPSAELRRGSMWRVGNLQRIDDDGVFFRIGRSGKGTITVYHDGKFADQEAELAPYTDCVVDTHLSVCAIAKKSRLAPSAVAIARQFARLLEQSQVFHEFRAEVEIAEIQDPGEFIAYLEQAHSIGLFWAILSRPNPFDADRDFVRPLQQCLAESDGERGKVELRGRALRAERLEELTRSVAATGDDAGARVRLENGAPFQTKRLRGNGVVIVVDDIDSLDALGNLLRNVRQAYRSIRGPHEG